MKILGITQGTCQATARQNVECAMVAYQEDDSYVLISLKQMPQQIRIWNAMTNGDEPADAKAEEV